MSKSEHLQAGASPAQIHGFEYDVGDLLTLGALLVGPPVHMPARFVVVACQLEICSGGIQRTYVCRVATNHGDTLSVTTSLHTFHEHELAPWPNMDWWEAHGGAIARAWVRGLKEAVTDSTKGAQT